MDNQLKRKELDQIEAFISSRNVPYLDVKLEIIDHFACSIESMRVEEPSLSIEEGINREYSKYPITGFAVWMLEIENDLRKLFAKNFLQFFLGFFIIPKIAITLLLFLGLYGFYYFIDPKYSIWFLCIIAISSSIMYEYTVKRKYKLHDGERFKFVALQAFYDNLWFMTLPPFAIVWVIYVFRADFDFLITSEYFSIIMSAGTTFLIIWLHIAQYEMPKALEKILKKRYSLYRSVSI